MMLENILVAAVLLFLAGMAYSGSKKGFMKILYSFVSLIIAMMISQCLTVPVSNYIEKNTPVYEQVKKQMDQYVEVNVKEEVGNVTTQVQENVMESLALPSAVTQMLFDGKEQMPAAANTDELCESISEGLTRICMRAIVIIVIFVITVVILRVISGVLNIFARFPIVKEMNQLSGAVIGLAEGIVILWVLCIVVMAMTGTPNGDAIMNAIEQNAFLSFIYNTNLFIKLFGSLLTF